MDMGVDVDVGMGMGMGVGVDMGVIMGVSVSVRFNVISDGDCGVTSIDSVRHSFCSGYGRFPALCCPDMFQVRRIEAEM
jgi:hypothetical protein